MKEFATPATNVISKLQQNQFLRPISIKNPNMKVSATLCKYYCKYRARSTFNFQKHVSAIHEGVRYPCGQCDYKATFAGNLKKHVESNHEGVRYPCDQCNNKLTETGSLRKHVK